MEYDENAINIKLQAEALLDLHFYFPSIPKSDFPLAVLLNYVTVITSEDSKARDLNDLLAQIGNLANLNDYEKWEPSVQLIEHIIKTGKNKKNGASRLSVINYLLDYVITSSHDIHPTYPGILSILAAGIHKDFDSARFIDLIPTTASTSFNDPKATLSKRILLGSPATELDYFLLEMKFKLNKLPRLTIEYKNLGNTHLSDASILIAPTTSKTESSKPTLLVEVIKSLGGINLPPCRLLIATPNQQDAKSNKEKLLKNILGDKHSIEAVINFSSAAQGKKGIEYSLIVVDIHPKENKTTVYIDVSTSNKAIANLSPENRAILGASIYRLYRGQHPAKIFVPEEVESFLRAQFSRGYRDVKNICVAVLNNPGKLVQAHSVKQFIRRHQDSADTVSSVADLSEILQILHHGKPPSCIFVIGNNGAGKSLLLRELITRLGEQNITTVGISTTIHDRFPSSDATLRHRNFIYKGARTSSRSIMLSNLHEDASQQTANIFKDQHKLDALVECFESLGYAPRFYLIKKAATVAEDTAADEQFIKLDLIVKNNKFPPNLSEYEFGLVRAGSKEQVRPYSALSSGEQNVTHLLLRIITNEQAGRVFLVDEPEVSLHLQWQQSLPRVFGILSRRFHISFVVATHSPTVITNASDPLMHCFQLNKGELRPLNEEERFSVESIILEGFDTYTPNNRGVHEKCAKLVAQTISNRNTPNGPDSKSALKELKILQNLVKTTGGNSSGASGDLELIRKAHTAISLLLQDDEIEIA